MDRAVAALRQLEHAGLCAVYGGGCLEDRAFLEVQRFDGVELPALLESRRLSDRQVVSLADQVGGLFAYLHERRVALSPEEISGFRIGREFGGSQFSIKLVTPESLRAAKGNNPELRGYGRLLTSFAGSLAETSPLRGELESMAKTCRSESAGIEQFAPHSAPLVGD